MNVAAVREAADAQSQDYRLNVSEIYRALEAVELKHARCMARA